LVFLETLRCTGVAVDSPRALDDARDRRQILGGSTPGFCDECRYSAYKKEVFVTFFRHTGVSRRGRFSVNLRLDNPRPRHGVRRRLDVRRAAVLLEVVISVGLLLAAMIAIGVVFFNGKHFVEKAEQRTRAMLLTDKLITALDAGVDEDRDGVPDIDPTEREQSSSTIPLGLAEAVPGMSWRIEIDPSPRVDGLFEIDIHIYMGDPDDEDNRINVLRTRIVRAEPRGLDFERDFGLDESQIEELTNLIPGGAQLLDPANFDPRSLAQLPADQLVEMLPTLIQAFGSQLGPGQLEQLMNLVNSGNLGNLQGAANQAINNAQNGGGAQGGTQNNGASNTPDAGKAGQ